MPEKKKDMEKAFLESYGNIAVEREHDQGFYGDGGSVIKKNQAA